VESDFLRDFVSKLSEVSRFYMAGSVFWHERQEFLPVSSPPVRWRHIWLYLSKLLFNRCKSWERSGPSRTWGRSPVRQQRAVHSDKEPSKREVETTFKFDW